MSIHDKASLKKNTRSGRKYEAKSYCSDLILQDYVGLIYGQLARNKQSFKWPYLLADRQKITIYRDIWAVQAIETPPIP